MLTAFFLVAVIIALGFIAAILFERTRVSEVILLMGFGFLIGPVFGVVDASSGSIIAGTAPFLGTLALILLLFEAGLNLKLSELVRAAPSALVFTIIVFVSSALLIAGVAFAFGFKFLEALLFGAVLGGTSSEIVFAMLRKVSLRSEGKAILSIESTFTDALCIISTFVLVQLALTHQASFSGAASLLASAFTVGGGFGVLGAVAWLFLSTKLPEDTYHYMLTLAAVFAVYALSSVLGGNGGFSVFVFGLTLASVKFVSKLFPISEKYFLKPEVKHFQGEVSFFTRTFFFVYMGLVLSLSIFTVSNVLIAVAMIVAIVSSRHFWRKILLPTYSSQEGFMMTFILPRGLASAVLASAPATAGIMIAGFEPLVLLVILASNVLATIGVFVFGGSKSRPVVTSVKQIIKKSL